MYSLTKEEFDAKVDDVVNHVKAEPLRLRMGSFFVNKEQILNDPKPDHERDAFNTTVDVEDGYFIFDKNLTDIVSSEPKMHKIPDCNTAACFAGWLVIRTDGMKRALEMGSGYNFEERAMQILDVPEYFISNLFYVSNWPALYRMINADDNAVDYRYSNAISHEHRVTIFAEVCEVFKRVADKLRDKHLQNLEETKKLKWDDAQGDYNYEP